MRASRMDHFNAKCNEVARVECENAAYSMHTVHQRDQPEASCTLTPVRHCRLEAKTVARNRPCCNAQNSAIFWSVK